MFTVKAYDVESWLNLRLPNAGENLHSAIYAVACEFKERGFPMDAGVEVLTVAAKEKGRVKGAEREVRSAFARAYWEEDGVQTSIQSSRLPRQKADLDSIRAVVSECNFSVADWFDVSPIRFDEVIDQRLVSDSAIDMLFPGNPLICVGANQFDAVTESRDYFRGRLHRNSFIVPNAMSAKYGATTDDNGQPKQSMRTLNNVGPIRYLVIDFDWSLLARDGKTETLYAPLLRDWQAQGLTPHDCMSRVLIRLVERFQGLACVVDTAGKSLHGWFDTATWKDQQREEFKTEAARLGADVATFNANQWVRLPGGTRNEGKRKGNPQPVLYFNPQSIQTKQNNRNVVRMDTPPIQEKETALGSRPEPQRELCVTVRKRLSTPRNAQNTRYSR